jgi:hypothetical protein
VCLPGGVASLAAEVSSVVREGPLYFEAMIVEDVGHQGLRVHSVESGGWGWSY